MAIVSYESIVVIYVLLKKSCCDTEFIYFSYVFVNLFLKITLNVHYVFCIGYAVNKIKDIYTQTSVA